MPENMKEIISSNYKYIFDGTTDYVPFMEIKNIANNFKIDDINIESFNHNHGSIDAQTYRINNFAYSTDLKKFYNSDIEKLKNLDLWIVGLLRNDPHPTHAGFEKIIEYINYIKPKKTILTHMTALLDEEELNSRLPDNVIAGHDGMEINI